MNDSTRRASANALAARTDSIAMTDPPADATTAPDNVATGNATTGRRRLLVGLFGLVTALLFAELVLWLTHQPHFPTAHSFPSQFMLVGDPDPGGWIRHVNKPSESIRFRYESDPRDYFGPGRTVTHTTNSLGFRGPEFPLRVTRGGHILPSAGGRSPALRIAFLGDSVTFGEGVHDADTFVTRIGHRLESLLKQPVETYNFGVGGHNTSDALWTWQRYARHLKPSLVVYTFVLNDAEDRLFRLDNSTGQPARVPRSIESQQARWSGRPETWWSGSRLARLTYRSWAAGKLADETLEYYRQLNTTASPSWSRCQEHLKALQQIDTPLAVVVFPILHHLDTHPFRSVHRDVAAVCESAEVIDLWEAMAKRAAGDTPSLCVHPTDTHPNEIAHAVAARAITARLKTLFDTPPMALFSVP